MAANASRYQVEHVAKVPRGFKVRSVRERGHIVRIAFPPGRRRKGSGEVVEILHPKKEKNNPTCQVAENAKKNPSELLIFGNPKKRKAKNAGGGFGNHRPGCPCAFCERAAKLQSGELQPPALPGRRQWPARQQDWRS